MAVTHGSFDITTVPEEPFATDDGILLGRMTMDKVFTGGLVGRSTVHMTYARTPVETSAAYVAVERIVGSLDGRVGSFVVVHTGLMDGDEQTLDIVVVPGSGTGELTGLSGTMTIDVVANGHDYTVDYELSA